ncbi:MAG: MFS transporter, partial [Candidatus Parcubacteria bacterium]|nr:MFS transporter [Burkholderiales bacterium]
MGEGSQFALLTERRFLPFFLTQFFGAANDNVFKFAFTILATYSAAEWGGLEPKSAGAVIGGIFILPFVLFSATAGQLADKYDKSAIIRFVKNLEIAIMLAIAAGFVLKIVSLLLAGVFLMGLHSTLFGPVKYAYLPQHLRDSELVGVPGVGPDLVAVVSLVLAIAGRIAAGFVPASPAPEPGLAINWNPFTETWKNLGHARTNRSVFLSLLGISWLWFFGSIFLTTFTGYAKETLGGDQNVVTLLLAVFSIGIGVGSLLCERLSGHTVEIGLVPFGSIGLSLFGIELYFASVAYSSTVPV